MLWYQSRKIGNGGALPMQDASAATSVDRVERRHGSQWTDRRGTIRESLRQCSSCGCGRHRPAHQSQVDRWWTMAAIGIVSLLVFIPNPATLVAAGWTESSTIGTFTSRGLFWVSSAAQHLDLNATPSTGSVGRCSFRPLAGFNLSAMSGCSSPRASFRLHLLCASVSLPPFVDTQHGMGVCRTLPLAPAAGMFSGTSRQIWVTPSSTILRVPFDVVVYSSAMKHARSGEPIGDVDRSGGRTQPAFRE